MKDLKEIKTPEELAQNILRAQDKKIDLLEVLSEKTIRLNLLEEINRNLEQEVQFRSARVVGALVSSRENYEELIVMNEEVNAVGHQLESDRAMMDKIKSRTEGLKVEENFVFNNQNLMNILALTQRKHVKR